MKKLFLTTFLLSAVSAQAAEPIKIGGIYSYTGLPDWMEAAQNAAQMAIDEQNATGGIMGRPVELLIRDDRLDPNSAIQVTQDLVQREKVVALTGISFSHIALAIVNQSDQLKIPYVAGWCWKSDCTDKKDGMVFTMDEYPTDTIDDLAIWAAKQKAKRWAILVPTMEYGMTSKKYFEDKLKELRPDVEIVDIKTYEYGKGNFSSIIRSFQQKRVEAVFNASDSGDLAKYLREARKLGFDQGILNVNSYLPYEGLVPLKEEGPKGWFVLGFPGPELKEKSYQAFTSEYMKAHKKTPGLTALLSYINTKFLLKAIEKAKSTEPKAITEALKGLTVSSPIGDVTMGAKTRRSDLGYWYGYTDVKNGKPILRDFYRTGEKK